jgi:hypothetical protein
MSKQQLACPEPELAEQQNYRTSERPSSTPRWIRSAEHWSPARAAAGAPSQKRRYHFPRPAAAAGPPSLLPSSHPPTDTARRVPAPRSTTPATFRSPSDRAPPETSACLAGCFARNGWATWTRALRWGRSCAYVPRDDASWPRSNRAAGLRCRIRSAVCQVTAPRRSHSVLTLRIGDAGWGTKGVDHWLGNEGCGLDAGKIRGWCAAGGERGIRGGGE